MLISKAQEMFSKFHAQYEEMIAKKNASLLRSTLPNPRESYIDKSIRIFSRTRPLISSEKDIAGIFPVTVSLGGKMGIHLPKTTIDGRTPILESKSFKLDAAFGADASNEEVYYQVAKPVVQLAPQGGSGAFIAYGKTSSGKSYTMSSIVEQSSRDLYVSLPPNREVRICAIEILGKDVSDISQKPEVDFLSIPGVELKSDKVAENAGMLTTEEQYKSREGKPVTVRSDWFCNIQLQGAFEFVCTTEKSFKQFCSLCFKHRKTSATLRNAESSRSHAIIRVRIVDSCAKVVQKVHGKSIEERIDEEDIKILDPDDKELIAQEKKNLEVEFAEHRKRYQDLLERRKKGEDVESELKVLIRQGENISLRMYAVHKGCKRDLIVQPDAQKVSLSRDSNDGYLFFVDLAGSERASDRKSHDSALLSESKCINRSLMTLKQCIKGRSMFGRVGSDGTIRHVHIPFRDSKLTLILKDCFDVAIRRPSRVGLIACVSPLSIDHSHSINTLRYATALMNSLPAVIIEEDPDDITCWNSEQCMDFLREESGGTLNPECVMLAEDCFDGKTLVKLEEDVFIERCIRGGLSRVQAMKLSSVVWNRFLQARIGMFDAYERAKEDVLKHHSSDKTGKK
ncbi:Kinesin-like protein like protein [Aduncisulcus paluster]|uniref:Kinesin-like protein like protein n=1 Tax=Aduncisulcus paluster TaxID=2918883 RepID=A0ABQ5KV45_9EUKA|nr:Kinesin-like protein like protein [Aduncisulcus paluster]